jgi:hypothetical protein
MYGKILKKKLCCEGSTKLRCRKNKRNKIILLNFEIA